MVNLACERRTLTPASTRRDRNAEATRQVIMQAGRELFATQPYPEITGLQICVRAGVTRGALQHHFGSKLGLFMAIFDGLQSDGVSRVADALADHDDHGPIFRCQPRSFIRCWSRFLGAGPTG